MRCGDLIRATVVRLPFGRYSVNSERRPGRDVRQAGREDTREREALMLVRGSQGGMSFGEGELDEKRSS